MRAVVSIGVVATWLGLATGLVIRDEDRASDLYRPSDPIGQITALSAGGNSTAVTPSNTSTAILGDDRPPESFAIEVRPKTGGRIFPDKYDVYKVVIDCAAYVGLHAWNMPQPAVSCDQSASLRLAFTGNPPPRPTLETRTVLWSLYDLLDWYVKEAASGSPKWVELGFLVWMDERTRLGIGQAIAKPGLAQGVGMIGNETSTDESVDADNDASVEVDSYGSNVTAPSLWGPDLRQALNVSVGEVDVAIEVRFRRRARPVSDDAVFYRTMLKFIIGIAKLNPDSAIPIGYQRYDETHDLTLGVQVTSKEAGEEGLLKVWIAFRALQQLAYQMACVEKKLRFHAFDAKILTGPIGRAPTRIVGRIFWVRGRVQSLSPGYILTEHDEEDEAEGSEPSPDNPIFS